MDNLKNSRKAMVNISETKSVCIYMKMCDLHFTCESIRGEGLIFID